MKLKRFALRGLAILATTLLLCAFFSGTVRTITTAKVKLTSGRMGKLEEKLPLTATVTFLETEDLQPVVPDGMTITIRKVNTRAGYVVREGDVLIEAYATGYEESMKSLRETYEQAESELAALDAKNKELRVRQADRDYVTAYSEYQDARSDELLARIAMDTLTGREGLTLSEDFAVPDGASQRCAEAIEAYKLAKQRLNETKAAFQAVSRYSISDEVFAYLTESAGYRQKMNDAEADMRTLAAINSAAAEIVAPHDGYVVSLDVKEGDTYDGKAALAKLSAEGARPVFVSDVTDVGRTVTEGSMATIESGRYGYVDTRVNKVETGTDGRKYAYLDVNDDVISWVGSVYSLMQAEQTLTLSYKAREATCLVPAAAVHGTGDDRYLFTVNTSTNAFGGKTMTVSKMTVKVLSEVDGVCSLEGDVSYYTLAYMEDRTLSDGDACMEYTD